MTAFGNRLPVGPGSRGGRWHDPTWRAAYYKAWRRAHPDYREREALRRAQVRAAARGDIAPSRLAPKELPEPAVTCVCDCGCREHVVVTCGFCREGQHAEESA